ncbi:MAG: carbon-nitrogen hydrolase family protein [Pseudomonadota bacterium]
MKLSICEFPDEAAHKRKAWDALVEHVAAEKPDIVVLPEMPFCDWIFVGDTVDLDAWRNAMNRHDEMIGKFGDLACRWVMSSRPVEREGRRLNEAFLWSAASGYQAIRSKWYLPNLPVATESIWFDQGDRNFSPAPCGPLRVGFKLCSEIMFPEHAREIGFANAHLIAHPRATGSSKKWRAAVEMSAITSGCYVASANRRSYDRDLFTGGSWLLSPEAAILGETTVNRPFVTVEIDISVAERAKTTYPRDLQKMYCGK